MAFIFLVASTKKEPLPALRGQLSYVCGQQDLNLHGLPPEPKSGASANSAMPAYLKIYYYKEKMTKTFSDSVM